MRLLADNRWNSASRQRVAHDDTAHPEKNDLCPHLKKYWRIPPTANAAFVACMEDVLDVYCRAYDAHFPVVCMDETSRQLIGEVHEPIGLQPGNPTRCEYEYVRNGVAQIFLEVEPLTGRRHVEVASADHARTGHGGYGTCF